MVSNITIRRARADDVAGIQRVARQSWHEAYNDFIDEETVSELLEEGYSEEFLSEAIASPEMTFFVAEDEYSVVGYVSCEPPTDGHIGQVSIYVAPDYWGEGIGTSLLERAREYLAEKDAAALEDVVLASNDVGNAFYRKHFERADETTVEMGDDEFDANVYRADL